MADGRGEIVVGSARADAAGSPRWPDELFARPDRVDTHDCSCGDLAATIARHEPHPTSMAARVLRALTDPGSMRSHYQPIVDLRSGGVVAHEALLRLTDEHGAIPPGDLFGASARGGWVQALDQMARRTAILGAGSWLGDRSLFINFVPSSIYDPRVCLRTTEMAAAEAGVTMDRLVFEVVETERIRDIGHLRTIFDRYHELGARVALDDLGAGHSSLEVARALRPDVLKLDGAVVRAVDEPVARRFVADAVELADEIGAVVLAEGIEDERQADRAVAAGVTLGQGWFYGRPEPAPAP
jgi:EAL domain-containing protein (putative c-di-GMP-specific phosphodiesterase class I)